MTCTWCHSGCFFGWWSSLFFGEPWSIQPGNKLCLYTLKLDFSEFSFSAPFSWWWTSFLFFQQLIVGKTLYVNYQKNCSFYKFTLLNQEFTKFFSSRYSCFRPKDSISKTWEPPIEFSFRCFHFQAFLLFQFFLWVGTFVWWNLIEFLPLFVQILIEFFLFNICFRPWFLGPGLSKCSRALSGLQFVFRLRPKFWIQDL